jgi:BlaI family transcriptional regulator, penicillinase repressor
MPRTSSTLTSNELAIMKAIWGRGDGTVREIYETLRRRRRIAYTTVLTMMNILEAKGYLKKVPEGRAYRYRSTQPQQRVLTAMVREFVDRVFDGAAKPLLASLSTDSRLSKTQRAELRRLIEDTEE